MMRYYSIWIALACGLLVTAQFAPDDVCVLLECCVEDCCGEGTSWNTSTGSCLVDLGSPGFNGTHSPDYDSSCKTVREWGCCEGACCGTGTLYNVSIAYCVPDDTPLNPETQPPVACCDPDAFPLCFIGTAECCLDGQWSCPNGFTDVYLCAGEETTGPFSQACNDGNLPGCPDDVFECPDGTFVSRDPSNNCEFSPCCCNQDEFLYCLIGVAACCYNGEWSCPDGNTGIYLCGGEETTGPFSQSC